MNRGGDPAAALKKLVAHDYSNLRQSPTRRIASRAVRARHATVAYNY